MAFSENVNFTSDIGIEVSKKTVEKLDVLYECTLRVKNEFILTQEFLKFKFEVRIHTTLVILYLFYNQKIIIFVNFF